MKPFVLDASVVIKWFSMHDENDLGKALDLRQQIADGRYSVIVPDLLLYEFANALRYNARFSADDVSGAVQSVIDMGFDVRGVKGTVMKKAAELAFRFGITVYDAYYLSLAQIENKSLITADHKMAAKVKKFKHVMRLSDF